MTTARGVVSDGEFFTINNGSTSITFEFDNVDLGNGFTAGRIPILFRNNSTPESVVDTMKAVIEGTGLGLTTTVMPAGTLQLNDTPRFIIDSATAPSLRRTGVPGGAKPVTFIQDRSFDFSATEEVDYRSDQRSQRYNAGSQGSCGNTLFVENAVAISSEIDNFYLQGISDLAGNDLKPNRINNETSFTILMLALNWIMAMRQIHSATHQVATQRDHVNDGARHAISQTNVLLVCNG